MISFAQSLPVGNAVRIVLSPPAQAASWRLLRKATDDFTGQDDPAALVVIDGDVRSIVDRQTLVNGSTYYYKAYWFAGATWTPTASVPITVAANYQEVTDDVLMLVRERLDLGLLVELQRGKLKHPRNKIPVLTAFPFSQEVAWPVVTVHLSSGGSDGRAIGEMLEPDSFNGEDWELSEGWIERVRLDVIAWSQNPDERQSLRQAIRRLVIANLQVFDDAGMIQIDLQQMDGEEPGEKNTVIYKSIGSFSCLAPVQVVGLQGEVVDVEMTLTVP